MKHLLHRAFLNTLPIFAGYIALGFGFGILVEKAGYNVVWAICMSLFIFAGSMQYVEVSLLSTGASLISVALTTLVVNARHIFYGITMIRHYKGAGALKPYMIFGLTDETYSMVCSGKTPAGVPQKDFYKYSFLVTLFNHAYWIMGGVLGNLVGAYTSFNTAGVEFSMTALFITVFVEQWQSTKNHLPALTGVGATVVCLLIFGSENFLIPSMILISMLLLLEKRLIKNDSSATNGKEGEV